MKKLITPLGFFAAAIIIIYLMVNKEKQHTMNPSLEKNTIEEQITQNEIPTNESPKTIFDLYSNFNEKLIHLEKKSNEELSKAFDKRNLKLDSILPQYTNLWIKMAEYLNNHNPTNDTEAFYDAILRIKVSLSEAIFMTRYLSLIYGFVDISTIEKSIVEMQKKIINLEENLQINLFRDSDFENAELIQPFEIQKPLPKNNYSQINNEFNRIESKVQNLTRTWTYNKTTDEQIEEEYRPILNEFIRARLQLGSTFDTSASSNVNNDFTRFHCALFHAEYINPYLAYRLQIKDWIEFGMELAKLRLSAVDAYLNFLETLK